MMVEHRDPAVEAAQRQLAAQFGHDWARVGEDGQPFYTLRVRTEAAREALKPIRALAELLTAAAAFEDAEVEHGMKLVLNELAPLVYTSEELSGE